MRGFVGSDSPGDQGSAADVNSFSIPVVLDRIVGEQGLDELLALVGPYPFRVLCHPVALLDLELETFGSRPQAVRLFIHRVAEAFGYLREQLAGRLLLQF